MVVGLVGRGGGWSGVVVEEHGVVVAVGMSLGLMGLLGLVGRGPGDGERVGVKAVEAVGKGLGRGGLGAGEGGGGVAGIAVGRGGLSGGGGSGGRPAIEQPGIAAAAVEEILFFLLWGRGLAKKARPGGRDTH